MIDTDCANGVMDTLSVIDHTRRPNAHSSDPFGSVHVVLFGVQKIGHPLAKRLLGATAVS